MQQPPPAGYWQWTPVQPAPPPAPPLHPWYDYVILGLALAFIVVCYAVTIYQQIAG